MLGLAVGIDYALFILSRHRAQLAEGLDPVESMSRALATAGSAVVFAGTTVIIALGGLTVAQIPVLTVMGVGAAFSVTVAVSVALTLLPAIALLLGERLRPRPRKPRRQRKAAKAAKAGTAASPRRGVARIWVGAVTRQPIVTVLAVVILLGLAAVPALDLRLGLPDNSTAADRHPAAQDVRRDHRGVRCGLQRPTGRHRRRDHQQHAHGHRQRPRRCHPQRSPAWSRCRSRRPTRAGTPR